MTPCNEYPHVKLWAKCRFDKHDGDMEKMEEWNSMCGTRDEMVVTRVGKGCCWTRDRGGCSLMGKVVCSSLKFTQALPLNKLPSHRITLALSNIWMSEMENN